MARKSHVQLLEGNPPEFVAVSGALRQVSYGQLSREAQLRQPTCPSGADSPGGRLFQPRAGRLTIYCRICPAK